MPSLDFITFKSVFNCYVHKFELSDQAPFHYPAPQGFLIFNNFTFWLLLIISTQLINEYAWPFTNPLVVF